MCVFLDIKGYPSLCIGLTVGTLAFQMVKDDLAHAHVLGRNFYVLVLLDILQRLFQAEDCGGDDACLLVLTAGTHVGELLGLGYVHHQVVVMDMLAHNLSGIDLLLRINEELATVLQIVDAIGKGGSALH